MNDIRDPAVAKNPEMADTPQKKGPLDLPVTLKPEEPELEPAIEQPVDDYIGPQYDEIITDDRRIELFVLSADYDFGDRSLGQVWQGENGILYSSGSVGTFLQNSLDRMRYINSSLSQGVSPLEMFYRKMASSSLLRLSVIE